jgi:hypothetical protein
VNIFQVDSDPIRAAEALVDKHVVKMILETAQLLCTAHRVLDGTLEEVKPEYDPYRPDQLRRKKKFWTLSDVERENKLYSATHVNHPSAIWARASNNNYNWLYCHFLALLKEYTYRYGKVHKCVELTPLLRSPPANIPVGYLTQVTPAMPEEYIVKGNSVASYRNYYRDAKKHLHKWTKREAPSWLKEHTL